MGRVAKVTSTNTGKKYTISTINKRINNFVSPYLQLKIDIYGQTAIYDGTGLFGKKLIAYINYWTWDKKQSLDDFHKKIVSIIHNSKEPVVDYIVSELNKSNPTNAFIEDAKMPMHKKAAYIFVYKL